MPTPTTTPSPSQRQPPGRTLDRHRLSRHPWLLRAPWWIALLVVFAILSGIGLRAPSPPDEPRFVLAALHMVTSGDWLVPHRGVEFYAEKPPVFMWMIAAVQRVVRDWQVAFLLPSAIAALATLWLTGDLAARLWGRRMAPWAMAALWICLQFGLQSKRAQIDMVLVAMTTLSLWALLRHLLQGPAWWAFWLGTFMAGVGTVTKGVGFLPLLVLLPWALAHRPTWRAGLPRAAMPLDSLHARGNGWRWALGFVAFLAGTAVWLGPLGIAIAHSDDPALRAYAQELLFKQTGQRYANAWHHVQPAWYFAQVIMTLWLPAALLLRWLLPAWRRRLRRGDARLLLLLGWAVLVLLFFSASPGKREVYIFPALPALCIAAAPLLPGLLRRRGVQWVLLGYVLLLSTGLALAALAGLMDWSPWAHRLAASRAIGDDALHALLAWMLALGIAGLALVATLRLRRSGLALVLFTAALWIAYGFGFAPALDASSSSRALMQRVVARIGPDAELAMLGWREQNMLQQHLLQPDRLATDFGFKQSWDVQWQRAMPWLAAAPTRRWLFVLDDALGSCVARGDAIDIGVSNRNHWLLVPGTAVRQGCVPTFGAHGDDPQD